MFTITEQDRQYAAEHAAWKRKIDDAFGDVVSRRHPLLTAPAAEFIASSSLEQVLEERTKLLRYRYCKCVNPEHGVQVLFTSSALRNARHGCGLDPDATTRIDIKETVRKFISAEIRIENIRGPFRHGDRSADNLTVPGYSYYSLYLHY